MAIVLTSVGTLVHGAGTVATVTVGVGGVPAGSLIVAGVCEQGTATIGTGVTDTAGNTYTGVKTAVANGTANCVGQVYYAWNSLALVSGDTISYTQSGSGDSAAISVFYATGVQTTADPLDSAVVTSATGTSATPSLVSGTPSQAGELMVGVLIANAATNWPTGFTQDSTHAAYQSFPVAIGNSAQLAGVGGGAFVNSAATTLTYAPTITSAPWVEFFAGFKAAPSSNGTPAAYTRPWRIGATSALGRGPRALVPIPVRDYTPPPPPIPDTQHWHPTRLRRPVRGLLTPQALPVRDYTPSSFGPAIVRNVHYNLVAWASGTFVVGQRCSNAGNAYQCTTPGSSTAAPTGTGASINNGGVAVFTWLSAIDYTTIQDWATALPSTVTNPQEADVWTNGSGALTTAGTAYLTLSGHTTSALSYLRIRAAPGESFRDQGTGNALAINTAYALFQLPATTGSVNYFSISDNYVTLEGLQFLDPDATSGSTIIDIPGANVSLIGCIIDGFAQTGGASITSFEGANIDLENCLIIDRQPSGGGLIPTIYNAAAGGSVTNCTFIGMNNPTSTVAVTCNNTASGSVIARNCAVFGYPSGFLGVGGNGISADHCVFSAASIGSGVNDNGGNLVAKTTANQFLSATTDFRLLSSADCVAAGVVDTTDIPTGDDIYRQSRGVSWDVGAAELSAIVYALALAASDAQALARTLAVAVIRSAASTQSAALARLVGHSLSAINAQSVGLVKLVGWIRSAVDAQAASRVVLVGVIRQTTSTQASALARLTARILAAANSQAVTVVKAVRIIRAATSAEVAHTLAGLAFGKALSAASAEVAALLRQTSKLLSAASAQTAARTVLVSIIRRAVDAESTALIAGAAHFRALSATNPQAVARVLAVAIIRGATSAQATARRLLVGWIRAASQGQATVRVLAVSILRGAVDAQLASLQRGVAVIRAAVDAEALATVASAIRAKLLSAVDANLSSVVATFIHAGVNNSKSLGAISAESASLLRQTAKLLLATASSQVAALLRSLALNKALTAATTQAARLVRLIAIIRGATQTYAASVLRLTSLIRGAVDPSAASSVVRRAQIVSASAAQAEIASLARQVAHVRAFLLAATQAAAVVRAISILRTASQAMAASRVLLVGRRLVALSPATAGLSLLRTIRRVSGAVSAEVAALIPLRSSGQVFHALLSLLTPQSVSIGRGLVRIFSAIAASLASYGAMLHRFLPVAQRRRVVRLPPPSAIVMLPPSVRSIVVPAEEDEMSDFQIHNPEPAFFSPFDPTDEESFTFNWSVRAYAGDSIVFASIVSVPSGLNLVGPTFIDGLLVSVTVGPFPSAPTIMPVTYSLRCMVMFASGRISNYSIPFKVFSL